MLALLATAGAAGPEAAPRRLLVQVRDTPPQGGAAIRHGADGSYSVSTGSGDRDDRADPPGNGATLSTSNAVRRLRIREGERVRVDLPGVQSLQFHVPAAGSGAPAGTAGVSQASTSKGGNAATAPSVSGVVTFEAVTAFAARFALRGSAVRIELTPLRVGAVAAPFAPAATDQAAQPAAVTVQGRVGEWIALGDTDLSPPAASLNAAAEPARPASVWVRVDPEPAGASD